MVNEIVIMLGLFALGGLVGWLSRWGPLVGWAALAFPVILPPVGIGLMIAYC